jgi:hypothetical protein
MIGCVFCMRIFICITLNNVESLLCLWSKGDIVLTMYLLGLVACFLPSLSLNILSVFLLKSFTSFCPSCVILLLVCENTILKLTHYQASYLYLSLTPLEQSLYRASD